MLSTMSGKEVISVSRIDGLITERPDRRAKVELPKRMQEKAFPVEKTRYPPPKWLMGGPTLRKS